MKSLNRTQLKLIAIAAMVCDHVAWGFVEFWTPLGQILHVIGRLTIPIMCFFIAEGFRKTSSVKEYIKRMLLFSVVAMLPFYLFFGEMYEYRQNIIFDLLLGLLLLTVLEHKTFKRWQKVFLSAGLFLVSATIGGWIIMPMLYILVFYYVRDFKRQAAWICGLTIALQVFLIAAVELNRILHFSKYDWPWYDKLYFLGFMIPLLFLKRYNGEKGKTFGGRYFFYLFYPAHFLVLAGIRWLMSGITVYDIYVGLHVLALLVCIAIFIRVFWARPSRGQAGTVLLVLSGCIYTLGFLLEITSGNVGGFYAATVTQYFGECLLIIGFTTFVSEMCHKKVPQFIYALEWLISFCIMWLLFTTRENKYFYTYIGMDESGPFPRLILERNWGFAFFVTYMVLACGICLAFCIVGGIKSTGFERKRMLCTAAAIACPWLPNLIRGMGLTGGYEIPCLGIMGAVVLVGLAMLRYGYFDSISLAGENALGHGQEGIMVINTHHTITYFNKRMEEVFGQLQLKQNVYQNETLKEIFEGKIKRLETDGRIFELRVEPLKEGGYVQGHMLWLLDITNHHQALLKIERQNEQLMAAKEQAEEAKADADAANAAKRKFLAHMSHEIRTPINAVLGMDTMILRESNEPHIKEYAMDIKNAGQTLLSLINDILDFSKIESGKLDILLVEYDLSSLIHDISNMIKAKAAAKKLELNIYVDEMLPSKLLGDDVRIRQVLVNLLNNAVKYTREGSITLKVTGQTEGDKVTFTYCVEDTGIGIKEEDREKLFREFERIEEKRNRNIEGTGLGLSITTQLLHLMGSRLQVESVYGKGSKFYFTLEQQVVCSTPVGNLEERLKKMTTEYNYEAAFTAPKAEVLVVDDNATNHKVFASLLKFTEINVDVAESGRMCLDMIEKKHYDLIFLDHMMPVMDGIETLHRMKQIEDGWCKDTPVIALTANAITGAREMYLAEGFDDFLSKPINPEKLEQMILRLLPEELLQFGEKQTKAETHTPVANRQERKETEELPVIDGIDWEYGRMHLPDKQLLLDTVESFYKTVEAEAATLQRFYEERNNPEMLRQYCIKVHAMKSSANLIGAIVPGGMAKLLENASRNGQVERVEELHEIFLEEWKSYKEKLREVLPEELKQEKQEYEDASAAADSLMRLREALEDLDIDEMDKIMEQMEQFSYPEEMQQLMEQLSVHITNLDSVQGEETIASLLKMISK